VKILQQNFFFWLFTSEFETASQNIKDDDNNLELKIKADILELTEINSLLYNCKLDLLIRNKCKLNIKKQIDNNTYLRIIKICMENENLEEAKTEKK